MQVRQGGQGFSGASRPRQPEHPHFSLFPTEFPGMITLEEKDLMQKKKKSLKTIPLRLSSLNTSSLRLDSDKV